MIRTLRLAACGALLWGCVDADNDGRTVAEDCNDSDPRIFVGAEESCNGIDDDCDGRVDEDLTIVAYQDRDGDGFGDPTRVRRVCALPPDGVLNGDDCDDADPLVRPDGVEICNERDDDCDGEVDEGTLLTFYADADGDGHGVASPTVQACLRPDGFARAADDCDDASPLAWTGAREVCDGVDNDCDGQVDEDAAESLLWADADGDGYGDPDVRVAGCGDRPGVATNALDCDDGDPNLNPDTVDLPGNGLDDDCDGLVDEVTVPGDHPTIAAALAAVPDGGVIQLGAGFFSGPVDLTGRDLTFAGEGCERTVLYGGGGGVVRADGGTIQDLRISGGYNGGLVVTGGRVVAHHVCLEDNATRDTDGVDGPFGAGGGFAVHAGVLELSDALVVDNLADTWGGGGFVDTDGELIGLRLRVIDNYSDGEGGGLLARSGAITVRNSVFAGNRADRGGGGVQVRRPLAEGQPVDGFGEARLTIDRCTFVDNRLLDAVEGPATSFNAGSAVQVYSKNPATITRTLFAEHGPPNVLPIYDEAEGDLTWSDTNGLWNVGRRERPRDHVVEAIRGRPDFVFYDPAADPLTWDLRLQPGSAFVDALPGDLDRDGSAGDVGAYGGPDAPDGWDAGLRQDDDGDGLLDPWEARWGQPWWRLGATDDPDGDGLDQAGEQSAGTDPTVPDSDGDAVSDGDEVRDGTDPTRAFDRTPVAVIDAIGAARVGQPITLDGRGSVDPDGDAITARWTLRPPAGAAATLSDPTALRPVLTPDVPGVWIVNLEVADAARTDAVEARFPVYAPTAVIADQSALDAALATPPAGAVLALQPGAYTATLNELQGDLTVVGLGAPDQVVLRPPGGFGRVARWAGPGTLRLQQLTVADGLVSIANGGAIECSCSGSCLMAAEPARIELIDVVLRDSQTYRPGEKPEGNGGALRAAGCEVVLLRTVVRDNRANLRGGAFELVDSRFEISDSVFARNVAEGLGGALHITGAPAGSFVRHTVFLGNEAPDGAALRVESSSIAENMPVFEQLAFVDNRAREGANGVSNDGAILYRFAGKLLLRNVVFAGNVGTVLVSAARDLTASSVYIQGVGLHDNTVDRFSRLDLTPASQVLTAAPAWLGPPSDLAHAWTQRPGSPLLDAGFPEVVDRDGTRSSLGPGGGPRAPRAWVRDAMDVDGDGMSDGWERLYGLDPTVDDADADLDGDGATNLAEYQANTRPDLPP